ncbi:MAG: Binding-protein-dependent transport systems inner membrane component, partial [Thermotoga petrophila]
EKWYGKLWLLVAFVSPTFFSSVGVLTTWRWIFSSAPNGLLNYYLTKIGLLSQPISWFETPARAWACIIGVTVWWIMGFSVLLYLGALQRIPPEQYEAAKIDGAGPWARFIHITLPWMRNVLFFDVVRQVLLAFGLFDQVYFFTGGGPAGSTRTMVYYLYMVGFERQQLGRAAAISWYMFIIIFGFALINLFILTKSIRGAEGE